MEIIKHQNTIYILSQGVETGPQNRKCKLSMIITKELSLYKVSTGNNFIVCRKDQRQLIY